jgi:hypothetical protein
MTALILLVLTHFFSNSQAAKKPKTGDQQPLLSARDDDASSFSSYIDKLKTSKDPNLFAIESEVHRASVQH